MSKPLIVIPIGDPAGIGPEIVAKALAEPRVIEAADCIAVGDKKSWSTPSGSQGWI